MFDEWKYQLRRLAWIAWLVVRHRPFITCPFCKGAGGETSGYYEPEWTECAECWRYWDDLSDHGFDWFVGRMPLLQFIRAKVSKRFGLWYAARFRDVLACKTGRHTWMNEDQLEPGLRICCVCYEHKHEPNAAETTA